MSLQPFFKFILMNMFEFFFNLQSCVHFFKYQNVKCNLQRIELFIKHTTRATAIKAAPQMLNILKLLFWL